MSPYRIVRQEIIPPEADEVAAKFEEAARIVRETFPRIENVGAELDASWIGFARNQFFSHFDPFPGDVYRYADLLEELAAKARNIRVWVENRVWYDEMDRGP